MLGADWASVDRNKVDFTKLRAAGVKFVFLRAAYGAWTDTAFKDAFLGAKAAGLVAGAYFYHRVEKDTGPQIDAFVEAAKQVGGFGRGDLVPAFDLEFGHLKKQTPQGEIEGPDAIGMSPAEAARRSIDAIGTFAEIIRVTSRGQWPVPPTLYFSQHVWHGQLRDPQTFTVDSRLLLGCAPWIPAYPKGMDDHNPASFDLSKIGLPKIPAPWGAGNCWIRQYQGDAAGVPGISRYADLNKFFTWQPGETGARTSWVARRLGVAATAANVKAYQKDHGLLPDGVIGVRTFSHLAWERP